MWSQDIPAADCKKILINFCFYSSCLLFNPLHPKISIQVLHTVLHTFPRVYKQRGVILLGEIRSLSLLGVKVLTETNS